MIRVLVVDDSAVVRRVLSEALSSAPGIEVVGTAADPYAARDKIAALRPDVLTLDVEMPRMDGLTFLEKLMTAHPLPVVVVSSLTPASSATAVRALELGAVGVVCKPGSQFSIPDVARDVVHQVRAAALAKVRPLGDRPNRRVEVTPPQADGLVTTRKILAIGASTGGPRAIEDVLTQLPPAGPGTVIVQHMPAQFTAEFAKRLNSLCAMRVAEATDGEEVLAGKALIAPGGRHMLLQRVGATYVVRLKDMPAVNHHRPSVDVMMHSVAKAAGANAVGVILTGMGSDGAKGLLAMREAGAHTIAQDEETSIVFGMPKEAAAVGGAAQVLPLEQIAGAACAAI
ncbi:MAG: response regulator receiver modulated CheB methylesterase [Polyangiaceae bacterium]|jgi:two-component system chemotaxis response regulator CheB|nr:response regulator receiver modulated CheB methylesterase [Polyangiaceae bacterium]